MRLLVTGDRFWTGVAEIHTKLIEIGCPEKIEVLMHGNAFGVDKIAAAVAEGLGLPKEKIIPFKADWEKYGKPAGPIRNRWMLKEGRPTQVLAFHNNIAKSKGTKDMVEIARKAGVPVWCSWE